MQGPFTTETASVCFGIKKHLFSENALRFKPTIMKSYQLPAPIIIKVSDRPTLPNQPPPQSREVTISSLTLRQAIDEPILKRVSVIFFETRFPVIIWEGDAYDAVGNWTQDQLESAIDAALVSEDEVRRIVSESLAFPPQSSIKDRNTQSDLLKAAFPNGIPRPQPFVSV